MKNILSAHGVYTFGSVSFQHVNLFDTRSRSKIPHGARSVLMLVFPYYSKKAFCGNVSGYCGVPDYHNIVMAQLKSIILELQTLFPNEAFVPFVDSSPLDEVDAAVKAGLGARGKNRLLITQSYGSFVFIGEIVTTLQLSDTLCGDAGCRSCGLCQKSCPGQCIDKEGITKERCASFISQKKQELSEDEIKTLKKAATVFGCDICQLVCPHNKIFFSQSCTATSLDKNLFTEDIINTITEANVQTLYKSRAFGFRGLEVLRRNLYLYENRDIDDCE